MSLAQQALRSYQGFKREMSSDQDVEIQIFSTITSGLRKIEGEKPVISPDYAQALLDNATLWNFLKIDLLSPGNAYPIELKASLIELAEFTQKHTQKVLQSEASAQILVDINTSVLSGLIDARKNMAIRPISAQPMIEKGAA